ncbi:condensation domain-containing protein [Streptomyces sp. NPDC001480]|uniref:condensation domain-containing protein n=1 Tax=Streptomyces sp. NPDC001480 TaxID=3364577 RepID=UPI0036837CB7
MSSHHSHADAVFAVVHEPGVAAHGDALVFELWAGFEAVRSEAVAARIAERHPGYDVALDDDVSGRRVLRLTPVGRPPGGRALLTPELAADLLAPLGTGTFPVTGHQRDLLHAAVAGRDGPGRHVEQLFWNWSGPLDMGQFTAAWQSVAEREAVLRASFDWTGDFRLVLHDRAAIEVVRRPNAEIGWSDLLKQDRVRGFELHRPGLLRVTLLDGPSRPTGEERAPVRVLVSYHRALLDERGARLLVREFYRAYVCGGMLPGGERRPDIRDHAEWLDQQDPQIAREYWAVAAPPRNAAVSPGRPGGPTRNAGPGRVQRRLRPPQTSRLRSWAAARGAGESSALHVVWALLLYRAAGVAGPVPVTFGVHHSGRDLALREAAGIPGLLGNPLPMTVTVDPAAPLTELLRQVRDSALDLTAYAWVSGDRIREWSGRREDGELTDTLVRFDSRPELPPRLRAELEAQGIRVDVPQSAGGDTNLPITLVAQYDTEGGLVLTATYDRADLADTDASGTLSQCVRLLRSLPDQQQADGTVAQVLELLRTSEVPRRADRGRGPRGCALAVLRPGEPQADVICLVGVPGVPLGAYELLAREYEGPERIVSLGLDDPSGAPPSLVGELLRPGRRVILCGCGPAGRAAQRIAWDVRELFGETATVVLTGIGGPAESALALDRALRSVRTGSPRGL